MHIFTLNDGSVTPLLKLLPFPQPPPPAAKQMLSSLTFAISDMFDVKGYVTGVWES
ncbi:hypothetical protein Ahy_B03g065224 isoform B [Arachis hypogaea]|uniref:Uncharacterized protein n=1 Tax=Arachis hypogaea TaxID=3818 RepID=A0A445A139_ARAHY|nr:hypothetical protein Ahy_B03g065224 isoform B [Arachis hypogaea]